jgi:hypothetical protein
MPDELIIREKAREAIHSRRMSTCLPDRTWGGPGIGESCSVCGERINRDQLELEIQFAHGANPGLDRYHVHVRCFPAWDMERTKGDGHS